MKDYKNSHELTMYSLRRIHPPGTVEYSWLKDIDSYVSFLEKMSFLDESYLLETQARKIEKCSYQREILEDEISILESKLSHILKKNDKLFEKIKSLKNALEFYACDNSWKTKRGGHIGNKNLKADVCRDLGLIARKALTECENL